MNSIDAPQPIDTPPLSALTIPVLDLKSSVRAGFPSPAEDLGAKRIDLRPLF
jgi:hypothetical protein